MISAYDQQYEELVNDFFETAQVLDQGIQSTMAQETSALLVPGGRATENSKRKKIWWGCDLRVSKNDSIPFIQKHLGRLRPFLWFWFDLDHLLKEKKFFFRHSAVASQRRSLWQKAWSKQQYPHIPIFILCSIRNGTPISVEGTISVPTTPTHGLPLPNLRFSGKKTTARLWLILLSY